jgi:glycosyltransferase involved in cell wall biosynthesis
MFDDPFGLGVAPLPLPSPGLAPIRPGFVVAIPVRNEEERLPACLRALARQLDRSGQPIPPRAVRIVLFANNCTDQSASLARKLGGDLSLDVRVFEARLPPAATDAGNARRAAMDVAEAWLVAGGEWDGVILTTDADSQVAPDWIAENLAAFRAALRRFSDASISTEKANSYPRRFIGAVSLRTHTSDCSRSYPGCSTLLSTILGLITPRSRARALASSAPPIAALGVSLVSRWARTKL